MSRVQQANDRAAAFLIAQEEGNWSATDKAALDAWLAESDGNRAAYWRLKHSWREADRIGALGPVVSEIVEPRAPRRWWLPSAIAASLVLMVGAGYMIAHEPTPAIRTLAYETPVGGRRLIGMADGSRVQLNTASTVRTAVTDNAREVWLDKGEAYFEVSHREGRPFVVHAGDRQITVLGTKFSVRRDAGKVTVSVLEGRVRVDEVDGGRDMRSAIISRGDIAFAEGDATLVTARSEARVEGALAWRTGMLSFDQTSLSDVAAEFNRYNSKPMVVTDADAGAIRIGGLFPASKPEVFARLLRDAYGVKVTETPEAIKISN
ncbi:FecR family protein [Sphingomonas colocasiae]|uniref:FecR domain-containing protein n=1 Tax=Sphingomonas colocasiae TaxID=1848973 RepID=A0ABS7PIV0_9SPHN|nr:FecR domain-containing protein [Sphingomonas colocasiae]MBY8821225.1 FecR domain-containing protein [Sphingomonas colocasiae]